MIASAVIEEARDYHTTFSPIKHGDTMLLRELQRSEARFIARIVKMGAESAVATDIVLSADDIADAIAGHPLALPAFSKIVGALVFVDDRQVPINIITDERVGTVGPFYARLIGRELYLNYDIDTLEELADDVRTGLEDDSNWAEVSALRLTTIPMPRELLTLEDRLTLHDDAKPYLVASLVEFMARRSTDIDPQIRRELIDLARSDQNDVVDQFAARSANETTWEVTPVSDGVT